ncbi:hypothetical protein GIB67_034091 [Kingdonia uniflora]|uniref:Protein kinase domain-containing protein n=1 Tax=Kingdonia uniflora TaxID=39325 RepID=A0A7J7M6C3_9MAGN|nr:hypothetical protein GIB67_034091 [Kingdonia uniflora]
MVASITKPIFIFFFSLSFFSSFSLSLAQLSIDATALTQFRSQTDSHGNLLANWTTTTDPCSAAWRGVRCMNNRITEISLPGLDLRGAVDSLAYLRELRILDLRSNRLNGSMLAITNCSNLKLLYLSNNDFSGEIPMEIGALKRLHRLDVSNNNLHGVIPIANLSKLSRLVTIRLQNNVLTGGIQTPDLSTALPSLKELNLSNNALFGRVPEQLVSKFGERSFEGNLGLCGPTPFPLCSTPSSPATAQTVVPSNPSSLPKTPIVDSGKGTLPARVNKRMSTAAIVGIVVGNAVVLLVIMSFLLAYYCGRYSGEGPLMGEEKMQTKTGEKKKVYSSSLGGNGGGGDSDATTASDRSKIVFFDTRNQFELEDLLRASAEMLGKGNLGTVYKAVLDDGITVAVKRLKDANPCARKEFEQYMDVIGKLRHPNIVRLAAYYYAKEEKLLVYDYLPNGSLYYLLHGNRGPGRIPLDWTTRISLVLGAARGLARIHEEYSASKIPHGNIRSSNVLLDKNGVACISDFGLALLLNPIHATARLGGYRAPEQVESKRLSQKADVYSFGVLLLEILTGKYPLSKEEQVMDLPMWVRSVVRDEWTAEVFDPELLRYKNIEEELVAMLHVALVCVVDQAEKRPNMSEVAKMIEDIRVEQSPLGEDLDESRSSLSPSLATTEDAAAN